MATTSARGRRGSNPLVVESISEQLHSILCERITTGVYAPGSRLDPQAIAAEFGVGGPPGGGALGGQGDVRRRGYPPPAGGV
ncbi:hypothetical protein ACFRCM_13375, partial [Streptomyces halstedii]